METIYETRLYTIYGEQGYNEGSYKYLTSLLQFIEKIKCKMKDIYARQGGLGSLGNYTGI